MPSDDPEREDTGVDIDVPELDLARRRGAKRKPAAEPYGAPPKGLVGQRNVRFDGDDSGERKAPKGKPSRAGKKPAARDDDD